MIQRGHLWSKMSCSDCRSCFSSSHLLMSWKHFGVEATVGGIGGIGGSRAQTQRTMTKWPKCTRPLTKGFSLEEFSCSCARHSCESCRLTCNLYPNHKDGWGFVYSWKSASILRSIVHRGEIWERQKDREERRNPQGQEVCKSCFMPTLSLFVFPERPFVFR